MEKACEKAGCADRTHWHPTKETFKAYRSKEVDMCIAARKVDKRLHQNQTLFSQRTWESATAKMARQTA